MADASEQSTRVNDGRFGEQFDDEINASSVLWTTFWLAVVCALGMGITWVMQGFYQGKAEEATPPPSPVAEANVRHLPPGPLLQADPEGELEELRHEMAVRLSSFGWVDETSGLVHIPIDQAIDLVVARAGTAQQPTSAAESTTIPAETAAAPAGSTEPRAESSATQVESSAAHGEEGP